MAYSSAKPRGDADRVSPDDPLPLPLEGPGRCCRRGRSLLRTTSRKRRARRPQPSNVGVEGRVSDLPTVWRMPPWHHPQRTPGGKLGSGASTEPSIGLRIVNLAKHQVPRALAAPSSELPLRRIVSFVQLWSKLMILRSLKVKTHDYLRYRKAHTRTTDKNVHFSLPKPRKTVRFDHQRPKATVFRIAHPPERGPWSPVGAERPGAAPGQSSWPPERRRLRHRGGKTAQNRGARRQSGGRAPGEGRGPQGEGRGPQGGHSAGAGRQGKGRGPQSGARRQSEAETPPRGA